jgi:hypothetical protein
MMNGKKQEVYNALLKIGYKVSDIGTFQQFSTNLNVPQQRQNLYNDLLKVGYTENDLGKYDQFEAGLTGHDQPVQQSSEDAFKSLPSEVQEHVKRDPLRYHLAGIKLPYKDKDWMNIPSDEQQRILQEMYPKQKLPGAYESLGLPSPIATTAQVLTTPETPGSGIFQGMTRVGEILTEKDKGITRNIIDATLGLVETGINLIPKVQVINTIANIVTRPAIETGRAIGGKTGEIIAENIIHYGTLLPFGLKTALFIEAGARGSQGVKTLLDSREPLMNESDKLRIAEAFGYLAMAGTGAAYDPLKRFAAEQPAKFFAVKGDLAKDIRLPERGLTPEGESVLDVIRRMPEGIDKEVFVKGMKKKFRDQGYDLDQLLNYGLQPEKYNNNVIALLEEKNDRRKIDTRVYSKIFDPNNDTPQKVNEAVSQDYNLTPKQVERFNSLLTESDGEIKDAIFKTNPDLLNDKDFLNQAVFQAIKDPIGFENQYGIKPNKDLQTKYLNNVANFLNKEGILEKREEANYEKRKASEEIIQSTPLPQKTESQAQTQSPDWDEVFFQGGKIDPLITKVMGQYGERTLNSPELGDYRNEVLPTVEVMKRINALGLTSRVEDIFQRLHQVPSKYLDFDAYDYELLSRIALKEVESNKEVYLQKKEELPLVTGKDYYNNLPEKLKVIADKYFPEHFTKDYATELNTSSGWYDSFLDELPNNMNLTEDEIRTINENVPEPIVKDKSQLSLFNTYSSIAQNALGTLGTTELGIRAIDIPGKVSSLNLPRSIASKELLNKLEQSGNYDPTIQNFTNWATEYAGNPTIYLVSGDQILPNLQQLGDRPGFYTRKSSTNQQYIGINKDFVTQNPEDLYRTVSHETTHAATIQGYKENRQFRSEVNELMTDFEKTLRDDGKYRPEIHDKAFESGEEFLAYAMSNTGGFTDELRNTPIRNSIHSNFLDRLRTLIRNFYKKILSLKDATYFRGLETILSRHFGYKPEEQFDFGSNIPEKIDGLFEKISADMDKSFMITNADMQDPRVIRATAELLGKEKGLQLKDYYSYIKTYTYSNFKKELSTNHTWNTRAKLYYDKNYSKEMTYDVFVDKVIKNLFNLANTMDKIPYVKMIVNENSIDGITETSSMIKEYPDVYTDKDGNTKISMHEHLKLFDLMPELNELFENEFHPLIIDNIETRSFKNDNYLGNSFTSIASSHEEGKNEKFDNLFGVHNYIYLGNWADKKTAIILKPKNKIDNQIVKQISDHYQQKITSLVEGLLKREFGDERINTLLKNNGSLEKTLEVLRHPLQSYLRENFSAGRIIRLLLEDLKLGGQIVNKQLVSSLFDINRPETYNALTMFKRPYLVSLTRYVHQDPEEIKSLLNNLPIKNHGFALTDKGLSSSAVIINTEKLSDGTVTIDDKEYTLKQLFINEFGTPRLDGPVYYVDGGANKIWDYLHGAVKPGVKKGWIGNSFTDPSFRQPFYVKGAFHKLPAMDPLARWIQKNNITWLISSTAAKVNSYPTANLYDKNINQARFQIPFSEIQRDSEKPGTKDGAIGLPQIFTSNFMTKGNKSFVDKGWNTAINDIINYTLRNFVNKVSDINYASVIEHLKDKALSDTSEYGKSVAGVVDELLMRNIDKVYDTLVNSFPLAATEEQRKDINSQLNLLRPQLTIISESLGEKFGNFFQEPFFMQGLKSYLGSMLSDVINMKIPASYLVLSPDLGILSPSRIKKVKEYAHSSLIEQKKNQYEVMKPYVTAKQKFEEIDKKYSEETSELIKGGWLEDRKKAADELSKFEDVTDQYEKELEDYYDDQGNVSLRKDIAKEAIDKQVSQYLSETGHIKDGYIMIPKDYANEYGVKEGDTIVTSMVPSSTGISAAPQVVIAILPEDLLEPGAIIMNSEYSQTKLGKDQDIDTTFTISKSEAFTDEGWKGFTETLGETYKKHSKDIVDFYKENVGSDLTEGDVYGKQAKLDLITKHFSPSSFKEGTLFNPLSQSWEILEKFNKQIGIPVNRRKVNTFKSALGLKTKVDGQILNVNHPKQYLTYMLLDVLTHHMVDMPVDTGSFYYNYDEVRAFDHDNGSNFYEEIENTMGDEKAIYQIKSTYYAIKNFEDFLFTYALKLNSDYNLDDRQNVRGYEDSLKYISEQQDINSLVAQKDYKKLLDVYKNYVAKEYNWLSAKQRQKMLSIAAEYLGNMTIENLNEPAMNQLTNRIPLDVLPNITTSESNYLLTQGNIINDILSDSKFGKYKEIYDGLDKIPGVKEALNRIPLSKVTIPGLNIDSNRLLGKMFYMTLRNPELHELKAKVISLIYPVDQSTKMKSQIEKLSSGAGIFPDNIYQKTNAFTYPLLFDVLLKNKTYKFKGRVSEVSIGIAKLHRTADDQLIIEYPGEKKKYYWHASELLDDNTVMGQTVHKYLKDQLANEPIARFSLSSMMSLGGFNTNLTEKEKLAIDLIDENLDNFGKMDQSLFWFSLLGKPDHQPKYPLNLVSPEKSSTENYHSQKILLHLLGQVKNDIAHRFLDLYAQRFSNNYVGKTIKEVQTISRLINDNVLDAEVYFQNKEVKKALKEVASHVIDPLVNHKTIWGIIDSVKKVDYPKDFEGPVDTMIDLVDGKFYDIDVLEVTDNLSAYTTRVPGNINHEAIAFTKAIRTEANMNMLNFREDNADNLITDYIKQQKKQLSKTIMDSNKKIKAGNQIITDINNTIENNPLGITRISKDYEDNYVIHVGDKKYSEKILPKPVLTERGLTGTYNDLIQEKGFENNRLIYQSALEYIKRYSVDNIQTLKNMQSLIYHTMLTISEDFGNMKRISELSKKYGDLINRFTGREITYTPKIVLKSKMTDIISNIKKHEAEVEVRKRVKMNWERKEHGLKANKKYLVDENKIPELIDDYLNDIQSKIIKNQYGDYIYAFQLGRSMERAIEGLYVKDSLRGHAEHRRMFNQMIMNDMYLINHLVYEHNAVKSGRERKVFSEMEKWLALSTRSKQFQTEKVKLDKLKDGHRIRFNYNNDDIEGTFKKQNSEYLYLHFDNDMYHEEILQKLNEFRSVHDQIIHQSTKRATANQCAVLKGLYQEGYITDYPKDDINNKDANDQIILGLEEKLQDPDTWGRYRKDRIYVKDYEGNQIVNKIGVLRYTTQTDNIWSKTGRDLMKYNMIVSRGLYLGGTSGARANWTDAMQNMTMDLGFPRFIYQYPIAQKYYQEFRVRQRNHELSNYIEYVKNMKDFMENKKNSPLPEEEEKYIGAVVAKVLLESGIAKSVQEFGAEIYGEDFDPKNLSKLIAITGQGLKDASGGLTYLREYVERNIRITAGYMFGYKAWFRDGVRDQKTLENIIKHGIGRTQGLYNNLYRVLGERTDLGRWGRQFMQYNNYMLQQRIMEMHQYARLGKSLNIRDFFMKVPADAQGKSMWNKIKNIQAPWRESIDPKMESKWAFDAFYTFISQTLSILFPGLRSGDPMGQVLGLFAYTLTQIAVGSWNSNDDGWDAQSLIFGILAFRIGTGYTIPVQLVYNLLFPRKNQSLISTVLPINSRGVNQIGTFIDMLTHDNGTRPIATSGWDKPSKVVADNTYVMANWERGVLGANFFMPAPRSFSSLEAKKVQEKGFPFKELKVIGDPEFYVPLINVLKYHK